ncbi:hypothetical protein GCM10010405_20230 [Streptomyces macrosporus]|uniref:Uncharacterized protein n=1 Tax=Streptomyces macrosporus TaxID=44032 RepID=A0ABP5WXZ0_9ACTN
MILRSSGVTLRAPREARDGRETASSTLPIGFLSVNVPLDFSLTWTFRLFSLTLALSAASLRRRAPRTPGPPRVQRAGSGVFPGPENPGNVLLFAPQVRGY